MHLINNLYGAFSEEFELNGAKGLITIHPELVPSGTSLKSNDNYFVFCVHPEHGSFKFSVEQDEKGNWKADSSLPHLTEELIKFTGERIERFYK